MQPSIQNYSESLFTRFLVEKKIASTAREAKTILVIFSVIFLGLAFVLIAASGIKKNDVFIDLPPEIINRLPAIQVQN